MRLQNVHVFALYLLCCINENYFFHFKCALETLNERHNGSHYCVAGNFCESTQKSFSLIQFFEFHHSAILHCIIRNSNCSSSSDED